MIFFFSALDDFLKKWCSFLRIWRYYVFNYVSYLIERVVVTACEMSYLQSFWKSWQKRAQILPCLPSQQWETAIEAKVAPTARTMLGFGKADFL